MVLCGVGARIRSSAPIRLLGLDLPVPDHTTLSRRGETLEVPQPRSGGRAEPVHLLVDSTGLELGGAGEWLIEKHGTKTRRAWRKLHIGMDAETGEIVPPIRRRTTWMTPRRLARCLIRWPGTWRRSPVMAPTTRMASIVRWRTTSRRPPSSCRRERRRDPVQRPRVSRPSATVISRRLPRKAGSGGRRYPATTNGAALRPPSDATSRSSVTGDRARKGGCARVRISVGRPRSPSPFMS
jgi:hypothetical protein